MLGNRYSALELAIRNNQGKSPETIVAAAEIFLTFLGDQRSPNADEITAMMRASMRGSKSGEAS